VIDTALAQVPFIRVPATIKDGEIHVEENVLARHVILCINHSEESIEPLTKVATYIPGEVIYYVDGDQVINHEQLIDEQGQVPKLHVIVNINNQEKDIAVTILRNEAKTIPITHNRRPSMNEEMKPNNALEAEKLSDKAETPEQVQNKADKTDVIIHYAVIALFALLIVSSVMGAVYSHNANCRTKVLEQKVNMLLKHEGLIKEEPKKEAKEKPADKVASQSIKTE
jgi:hypothetical protein